MAKKYHLTPKRRAQFEALVSDAVLSVVGNGVQVHKNGNQLTIGPAAAEASRPAQPAEITIPAGQYAGMVFTTVANNQSAWAYVSAVNTV